VIVVFLENYRFNGEPPLGMRLRTLKCKEPADLQVIEAREITFSR